MKRISFLFKVFTLCFVVVMALALVPVQLNAENGAGDPLLYGETFVSGNFVYRVEDAEASVVSVFGLADDKFSGAIKVPEAVFYNETSYEVQYIMNYSFSGTRVTAVTLPETVIYIGEGAFRDCEDLVSVNLPSSISEIPSFCFENCTALSTVEIPKDNNICNIFSYAFYNCTSLKEFPLAMQYLSTVEDYSFSGSGITEIVVPDTVSYLGGYAFENCVDLLSASIPSTEQYINTSCFENCTALESVTIIGDDPITAIGINAFKNCTSLAVFDMPKGLLYLEDGCFSGSGLTSVLIPETVVDIATDVFADCINLTSVNIPSAVERIPSYCFYGCSNLETVKIPKDTVLTSIGEKAFFFCSSLTNLSLPDGLEVIEESCFLGSAITTASLPDTLTFLGESAFKDCKYLESVTIPATLWEIPATCFEYCRSLETVNITGKGNLYLIGASAFKGCSALKNLTLPSSITCLEDYSFSESGITEIALSDSFDYIGQGAFAHCESLRTVNIPEMLDAIYDETFYNCRALENVVFSADSVLSYIGEFAFSGCSVLEQIDLPKKVSFIGDWAFERCYMLESLVIPDAVEVLFESTFSSCESLRRIVLPVSLLSWIDGGFFMSSECLEEITIGKGNPIYYSEDGILYGNVDFRQIETEKTGTIFERTAVPSILAYPNAKEGPFTIPDGIEAVLYYAFRGKQDAAVVTVPESVTYIGRHAFAFWPARGTIVFLSETPPIFDGIIFIGSNLIFSVPTQECVERYEQVLADLKPGGRITVESVRFDWGDDDDDDGNGSGDGHGDGNGQGVDPGGNDPGGNNSNNNGNGNGTGTGDGGNNPGGNNDGNGNNTGGNNTGGNGNGTGSGNGGSDSSGGRSSSSRSPSGGTIYASTQTTSDFRSLQLPLTAAIKAANTSGSKAITLQVKDYKSLDLATLKQLSAEAKKANKNLTMQADTMKKGSVQVRLQFNPMIATMPMQLTGSLDSQHVKEIKKLFEEYFENKVVVLELAQQVEFGMFLSVAAKLNLSGFDRNTLIFYSYNKATNICTRIPSPKYYIDSTGYLWFRTRMAGDIIITDSELKAYS